ncbi:hypothetical protein APV28_4945 [Comamonas testosteroni]|nr:hypothetical protein APV28_4945 [Comamonas testosteroni]
MAAATFAQEKAAPCTEIITPPEQSAAVHAPGAPCQAGAVQAGDSRTMARCA